MATKKRKGVTDWGKEYEVNMTALIALKLVLDGSVEDFLLGSNVDEFGSLDDIVVRIQYKQNKKQGDDGIKFFAIQLKHKDKSTLPKNELSKIDGDFSIKKCKKDYFQYVMKNIENKHFLTDGVSLNNVNGCLFTNANTESDFHDFHIESLVFAYKGALITNSVDSNIINTKTNEPLQFKSISTNQRFSEFIKEIFNTNFIDSITQSKPSNRKLFQDIDLVTRKTIMESFQAELIEVDVTQENGDKVITDIGLTLKGRKEVSTVAKGSQIVDYVSNYVRQLFQRTLKIYNELPPKNEDFYHFVQQYLQDNLQQVKALDVFIKMDASLAAQIIRCLKIKGNYSPEMSDLIVASIKDSRENIDSENIKRDVDLIIGHLLYEFKNKKQAEYAEFFDRFQFYEGQVNYKEAIDEINSKIQESFGEVDSKCTTEFIEYIKNHFRKGKYDCLKKREVKLKLLKLLTDLDMGKYEKELEKKYKLFAKQNKQLLHKLGLTNRDIK